jgi:hypothetical protein
MIKTTRRGTPGFDPGSRRAIVMEGILAVADADSDDDVAYHRAWCRFWEAVRAAGWSPKERDLRVAE